VTDGT